MSSYQRHGKEEPRRAKSGSQGSTRAAETIAAAYRALRGQPTQRLDPETLRVLDRTQVSPTS